MTLVWPKYFVSVPRSLQLAANGYADLYTLLMAGESLPLDFIKCPLSPHGRAEMALAKSWRPVLLHGWGPPRYSVTRPSIPESEWLQTLAPTSGGPWLSVHLDYNPQLDGELNTTQLFKRMKMNVEHLQELSGLPILLENMPYHHLRPRPLLNIESEFIAEALENSGAGFLLDLAHARVTAAHRQLDVYEYVSQLPLQQVKEIHISGPRVEDGLLADRHLALQEEDWDLLRWTLKHTPNLQILTHEYMGLRANTAQIKEQHGPRILQQEIEKMAAIGA